MRKIFLTAVLLIAGIFFSAAPVHAETQTYEGIGEYWITNGETPNFARKRAKEIAERDALEQIYFYLSSKSSLKNTNMLKDEIISIVAGLISSITKTNYSTDIKDGVLIVTAVVIAEIDPEEIPAAVEREKNKRFKD